MVPHGRPQLESEIEGMTVTQGHLERPPSTLIGMRKGHKDMNLVPIDEMRKEERNQTTYLNRTIDSWPHEAR